MFSWDKLNKILESFRNFPLFKILYKISWAPKAYHFILALAGALIYFFPSRNIKVIGVTGTKGKTTTIEILNAIFEKAGYKTAVLSSVSIKIDDQKRKGLGNSQPGRFFIQYFLKQAVKRGCQYAFIEVTSQGVLLSRHKFIKWNKVVFINIHPEHIESHGSFENYLKAKVDFFKYAAKSNKDCRFFINKEDFHWNDFYKPVDGRDVTFFTAKDSEVFKIPESLNGDFNKFNIAAASKVADNENISGSVTEETIKNFQGVLGRMNIVQKEPFKVIVDYAHTPDSLEAVYKFLKKETTQKLICVLGSAGGGRDKWKRPEMGKVAEKYCNMIILTDEDSYEENPLQILNDIESGFSQIPNENCWKILDRREAIKKSISLAKKGDIIISTGKGSEDSIHIAGGKKISWSETEEFKRALKS